MFSLPQSPQQISRLLDACFSLYSLTFKRSYLLGMAPMLIGLLPLLVFPALIDPAANMMEVQSLLTNPLVYVVYLITLAGNVVFYTALVFRQGMIGRGLDPGMQGALMRGISRMLPMFVGALCYFILMMIGMAAIMVMMMFGLRMGGVWTLLVIPAIALLYPWLYLGVSLFFFSYGVALERLGPFAALSRSHMLVRHNWWRTVAVLTIPFLIYIALSGIAGAIVGVAVMLHLFSGGDIDSVTSGGFQLLIQLIVAPVIALVVPLPTAAGIVQYNDLILRREGGDLEARLETL